MSIRLGDTLIAGNGGDFYTKKQITNCITEIPQDIILELDPSTYTITLKGGSKVYVPNGFEADGTTPHFDTITTTTDMTLGPIGSYTGSSLLYLYSDGSGLAQSVTNISGTTAPSGNGGWYDLNTNLIKVYSSGADTGQRFSLPIATATRTSGNWTSIDRIFNGFGCMDKTPFALPGVYGLVPNGRNPDGTLRSIVAHTESVLLGTTPNGAFIRFKLSLTSPDANSVWTGLDYKTDSSIYGATPTTNWYYDSKTNYWTYNGNRSYSWIDVCWCFSESNSITLFGDPATLEITDTNDKTFIGHQAMPSDKYATLTFGASGTTYRVYGDGYLVVNVNLAVNTYFAIFRDNSTDVADLMGILNSAIAQNYSLCIPIYTGQQFRIQYSGTPTWRSVRFYYSQGDIA